MGNQIFVLNLRSNQFKEDSVVIVTGASSGIGRELANRYAQRKCRILLAARSEDKLKEVQAECQKKGGIIAYMVCDVCKEKDCKELIEQCIKLYGKLDIMLLCAGINAHCKFVDIQDLNIFKKIMETNFYGYVFPTKYAIPYLQQSKGQIVVMSSMSGEIGLPFRTAYCSSKFAVTGFFEALRIELDSKDIAITLICPPSVKTPMRDHDLLGLYNKNSKLEETDKRIEIKDCVDMIILAADKRARKIFFPLRVYLAVYVRPFFPDFIDKKLKKEARL